MSRQPETVIVSAGIHTLRKIGAMAIKVHGSEFSRTGEPDVIGAWHGVPFAIECKQPGESLRPIQRWRLLEWKKAGARVGVATNQEDFVRIVCNGEEIGL